MRGAYLDLVVRGMRMCVCVCVCVRACMHSLELAFVEFLMLIWVWWIVYMGLYVWRDGGKDITGMNVNWFCYSFLHVIVLGGWRGGEGWNVVTQCRRVGVLTSAELAE